MAFIIKTREKTITDNGQEILYGLKMRSTPPTPKNLERIATMKQFFKDRIYTNGQIHAAPPGIYTWILKSNGNFYAAKTFTKQELGSLHINLEMLTSNIDDDIYIDGAGELQINTVGGPIGFNLLSGTFMASKFKKLSQNNSIKLRDTIATKVINKLAEFGISATFLESSDSNEEKLGGKKLLEVTNIRTSPQNIAILNTFFNRRAGGRRTRKTRRKLRRSKTIKRSH
jgi:hypothetical protein